MNKWLKRFLIFTLFLFLSLCILLVIPSIITTISDYISDQKTLEYQEYDKQGDNFVYEFESVETYNHLEKIVMDYNTEFGYDIENKILMGKGKKEVLFAEYDENSITIYCEGVANSKLTNKQIQKYLKYLINMYLDLSLDIDDYEYFIEELIDYHDGLCWIMLPIIFNNTLTFPGYPSDKYRVVENIIAIVDVIGFIYGILALFYLVYTAFYIIYCIIQKKKISKKKERVLLFVLSVLYLIFGGFSGIFSGPLWTQLTKLF